MIIRYYMQLLAPGPYVNSLSKRSCNPLSYLPPTKVMRADEPMRCTLVASFAARQAIILAAVLLFMLYTWIQIRRGVEKRSLTTLVADASKQAGQQTFGGAMMVLLGVLLAHNKYDSLAWYAAECAPPP